MIRDKVQEDIQEAFQEGLEKEGVFFRGVSLFNCVEGNRDTRDIRYVHYDMIRLDDDEKLEQIILRLCDQTNNIEAKSYYSKLLGIIGDMR